MSAIGVIALIAAGGAASLLLVYSGIVHALEAGAFRSVVTNHGVIPFRLIRVGTRAFTWAEVIVGGIGSVAAALVWWRPTVWLGVALIAVSAMYLTMVVYVARVVRSGSSAPCGCFGSHNPANGWTLARAAGLGTLPLALSVAANPRFPVALLSVVTLLLIGFASVLATSSRESRRTRAGATSAGSQRLEAT